MALTSVLWPAEVGCLCGYHWKCQEGCARDTTHRHDRGGNTAAQSVFERWSWTPHQTQETQSPPCPCLAGGLEQTGQALVLSSVKTDLLTSKNATAGRIPALQWQEHRSHPRATADQPSASDDAFSCLQSSYPENAHCTRLLLETEEISQAGGKQLTLRLAIAVSFPSCSLRMGHSMIAPVF